MKKAYSNKRNFVIFPGLLFICLIFFNISCGLDTLDAVLEDPFVSENTPNIESSYDTCHFRFDSRQLRESNSFGKGYVYYKIYNSLQTKDSEINNIESMTNDSSRKYNAASTLITNYSYKELHYSTALGAAVNPLILDNENQTVRIRLTNYVDAVPEYSARIFIDDIQVGLPLRYNGKTFDFGRKGSYDEVPKKLENDESASDTRRFSTNPANPNTFYVVLFGVFSMPTDSFEKIIYSPVHYLGEVKIDAGAENN